MDDPIEISGVHGVREELVRMLGQERGVTHKLKGDQQRQRGILQGLGMALQTADIAVRCEQTGHAVVSRDVNTIMDEYREVS